jgi:transposase
MDIRERSPGDLEHLRRLARRERNAEQKDRLMAAALAVERVQTADIQRVLNRSRGFVQRWAYAYRDGGIEALKDKPRGGSVGKISGQNAVRLMARIDAGPTAADKVCTLRGKDVQRIARDELGTDVSLTSVYRLLHKMGYSCLAPRPRHEKQDPAAQEKFKIDSAPLLSGPSATRSHLLAGPAESSSWTKPASASRAR